MFEQISGSLFFAREKGSHMALLIRHSVVQTRFLQQAPSLSSQEAYAFFLARMKQGNATSPSSGCGGISRSLMSSSFSMSTNGLITQLQFALARRNTSLQCFIFEDKKTPHLVKRRRAAVPLFLFCFIKQNHFVAL